MIKKKSGHITLNIGPEYVHLYFHRSSISIQSQHMERNELAVVVYLESVAILGYSQVWERIHVISVSALIAKLRKTVSNVWRIICADWCIRKRTGALSSVQRRYQNELWFLWGSGHQEFGINIGGLKSSVCTTFGWDSYGSNSKNSVGGAWMASKSRHLRMLWSLLFAEFN